MSINNGIVKSGVSALAPTGGTDITFVSNGMAANGVTGAYISNDTSMKTRRDAEFSTKKPKPNAASIGGYTQAYRKVKLRFPRTLADGSITYDQITIELRSDISTTDPFIDDMRYIGGQILADPDFDAFWRALNQS
jgi:hypothetical protein